MQINYNLIYIENNPKQYQRLCLLTSLCLFVFSLLLPTMVIAQQPDAMGKAIKQTFTTGNPAFIKQYLSPNSKIFLSIPATQISSGNYSRNQTMAILRQMFQHVKTESIQLQSAHQPKDNRGPIRLLWNFRNKRSGEKTNTTLYVMVTQKQHKTFIKSIRGEQ